MKRERRTPRGIRLGTWSQNTAVLSYLTRDAREVSGTGIGQEPNSVRGERHLGHLQPPSAHFDPLPPKPSI